MPIYPCDDPECAACLAQFGPGHAAAAREREAKRERLYERTDRFAPSGLLHAAKTLAARASRAAACARIAITKTFIGAGDFVALRAAEQDLLDRGFSVAPGCAGEPAGIMFGDCRVAKWRNLTDAQQAACHGILTGDRRNGPVTVTIFSTAPVEARAAFARELESAS